MKEKFSNAFLDSALEIVPRLLGLLNRNPLSGTYGSFDRAYWHYRVNDISSARYQEALLSLTLLYSNDFEGNIYFKNKLLLEWINAALDFTVKIQNKDGSFDEWYLNEGSFVATSFVTAAVAEACLILGNGRIKSYDAVIKMLARAADWICDREETLVFNQMSGSVLALLRVYGLTNNDTYKRNAEEKIKVILRHQTEEGWWSEYGGPDAGYLSLMIDYLSKCYLETKNPKILESLKKATSFLVHFIHPDLTIGGEYFARNTEYLIPSGFAKIFSEDKNARILLSLCSEQISSKNGITPDSLDDRYLCYILYNWLQAGLSNVLDVSLSDGLVSYLQNRRESVFFKEAGLFVVHNDVYYVVASLYKGGVFRIYANAGGPYFDSGIEIVRGSEKFISNSWNNALSVSHENTRLLSRGFLTPMKERPMTTVISLFLKSFQLIFGRISFFQALLKKFLRKKLVLYNQKRSISFERSFRFEEKKVIVEDVVNSGDISIARVGVKSSYNFIPSAKYYSFSENSNDMLIPIEERGYTNGLCRIQRTFNFY